MLRFANGKPIPQALIRAAFYPHVSLTTEQRAVQIAGYTGKVVEILSPLSMLDVGNTLVIGNDIFWVGRVQGDLVHVRYVSTGAPKVFSLAELEEKNAQVFT